MRDIGSVTKFLMHLDGLKGVERQSYVGGGVRKENSAEHSWHLAMACWSIAEALDESYDIEKLIKLALVHDLGEIGAGDTHLYSDSRDAAVEKERASLEQAAAMAGNGIPDLLQLWDEQEAGHSKEAALLKVLDRLLPFLLNVTSDGRAWSNNGISKKQVLHKHAFIEHENPVIWKWMLEQIDHAVKQGWLQSAQSSP